jgi:hypothetical protein
MSTQTLAAADAILKDLSVGPVVEQLNNKTYLIDQIERDSTSIDHTGRRAIVPLHTGRNRGRGGRADGGTLPVAGTQTWQDAIIKMTYQYIGIEITDAAIEASTSNEGAFLNLLTAEMKGATNDFRKDMNRQLYGTGDGLLATLTAETASGKVLTVDSVQYLQVGDPVDLVVKSTGATTNGVLATTIAARTPSEKKVELASAVAGAVSTTYGLYISGDRSNEVNGLRNIVAKNRTLHEINSETAGNGFWNANIREAGTSESSTAVIGESLFEQLIDDVGFSGQGEVEVILTTRGIRRRLADTYQSQKRFNDAQATKVHGGYTAIFVNEVPVIADDDAPRGWAFGLNKESFRLFQQCSPQWMEAPQGGGGIFHLKDGSTAGTKVATYQAWMKWYFNLGNIAPNRNGAIKFGTDDLPS